MCRVPTSSFSRCARSSRKLAVMKAEQCRTAGGQVTRKGARIWAPLPAFNASRRSPAQGRRPIRDGPRPRRCPAAASSSECLSPLTTIDTPFGRQVGAADAPDVLGADGFQRRGAGPPVPSFASRPGRPGQVGQRRRPVQPGPDPRCQPAGQHHPRPTHLLRAGLAAGQGVQRPQDLLQPDPGVARRRSWPRSPTRHRPGGRRPPSAGPAPAGAPGAAAGPGVRSVRPAVRWPPAPPRDPCCPGRPPAWPMRTSLVRAPGRSSSTMRGRARAAAAALPGTALGTAPPRGAFRARSGRAPRAEPPDQRSSPGPAPPGAIGPVPTSVALPGW